MDIKVKDYIKTAFSIEDAKNIENVFKNYLDKDEIIKLDFDGIGYYTTLFFNNALTKYVLKLNKDNYYKKFDIVGLPEIGKSTYEHSLQNAINYSEMSEDDRKNQDNIVLETDDD